ncbi:hypothetical protein PFICI_10150 [Pestalotiopsis fici W106-1]|uniref:Uncharacterized protein n=1 Tax=Pestalotiopsis fici (strain W106-1 / CGMCC3.15140) TaxID=1229662 RepID=W3WW35_PESFW|nr:uncharacterized protein PFICI_10150 [Pestalotiopsis fici W106-1]ETS78088.1 hypothetical protein PFICI_10150 [Pestalotiopsis fici W106-1]
MSNAAFWLITALLLYKYILYPLCLTSLSKLPSAHWSCSISPIWILWARFQSRENKTLFEAHERCGPIVRVGPHEVSIADMELVKDVYQGGFDKHEWYSVFNNYGVPCAFSAQESKHHSVRKRMVSHVYSKSFLHSSIALASQCDEVINSRLLPLLDSSNGHGIDVHSLFPGTVMDLISAYCFGLCNGSNFIQRKGYREHWLALYKVRKTNGFFMQELPRLSRALQLLGLNLTPHWATAANKELEAWCKSLSDAAIAMVQNPDLSSYEQTANDPVVVRSILSGIEKVESQISPEMAATTVYSPLLRRRELSVASEVFDHVLAGQETTGVTLTYLTWHLSRSPTLQSELRAELLGLTPNMHRRGGDGVGGKTASMPDPKQLDALPILQAVILETVRRYAPAGGPEPRVTPSPSCRVGLYEIPGSVRISASVYNLHRDERCFPSAETWDHRRWLRESEQDDSKEEEEEAREQRHRQFWGFSSGGRMCLGSNFAMYEMKLLIAAIYSNFASRIVNDDGIEPTDGYTAHPQSGQLWLGFDRITQL